MKSIFQIFIAVSIAVISSSCASEKDTTPQEIISKKLFVFLYDISLSNDKYLELNENHLSIIYDAIASNGGGHFYGIHIMTNSEKQDPLTFEILPLDTLQPKGDFLTRDKILKRNEGIKKQFAVQKEKFLMSVPGKFILPKKDHYTDLASALKLAKIATQQPVYQDYLKKIVLISDCINDRKGGRRNYDIMEAQEYSADVTLSVIRPNTNVVKLEELFPSNQYAVHTSVDEFIFNLKSNL